MAVQFEMPLPFKRMIEHLNIGAERSFKLLPEEMLDAIRRCRICKFFHTCDYDSESRYFLCPNRDYFDQLEDLLNED